MWDELEGRVMVFSCLGTGLAEGTTLTTHVKPNEPATCILIDAGPGQRGKRCVSRTPERKTLIVRSELVVIRVDTCLNQLGCS